MPLPVRRQGELADKPPHFRDEHDAFDAGWRPYQPNPHANEARSDATDQVRKAYYYGMTTLVDHNVGRILAALEETGQLDRTVVVYVSDHGDLLGDHWLSEKGPWHYDGCTRIPFLLRYPPALPAGRVVPDLTSQCDLAPTLCDLTGTPYTSWPLHPGQHPGGAYEPGTLPDVQGTSLLPVVRGQAPGRSHVLIEFEWRMIPGLQQKTLRTADWRLTVYAGRPCGELYDLRADPDEFVNRWADPALRSVRADLTNLLLQELLRTESRLPPREVPN